MRYSELYVVMVLSAESIREDSNKEIERKNDMWDSNKIPEIEKIILDTINTKTKLILVIGSNASCKNAFLTCLSERKGVPIIKTGAILGRQLVLLPSGRRHLHVAEIMKGIADLSSKDGLILVDNIEILFDRSLRLDPLELLKRHAQARCVVAVWPGELREGRLTYATIGHPEHQDYGIDGLVPFEIH